MAIILGSRQPCAFSIFWAFDRRPSWNIDEDIAILKIGPTFGPDDINDIVNTDLYRYSHNPMIHMYRVSLFVLSYHEKCSSFIYITMTNTFCGIIWHSLFISEVKWKLCFIFQNFQNGDVATNCLYQKWYPVVEYTSKIAIKMWHTLWPADVISYVMSAWSITCTTRQRCACKILFLWQQSFTFKSFGQTSWQT